ncbi:HPP family protein [Hypoxylon sp. FL1284]|nr:HPP family protein [Hypoxylon sp. FL1284]
MAVYRVGSGSSSSLTWPLRAKNPFEPVSSVPNPASKRPDSTPGIQMPLNPSKWHFDIDKYLNPWIPPAPWKHIPYPIAHFLGHRQNHPRPLGNIAVIFWAFIGILSSLIIIEVVGRAIPSFEDHGTPMIIGSFGAAAVLEFYAIESPLSQPRNAVLGQVFSSVIGVGVSKLFALGAATRDLTWLGGSLSCACAVAFMALTGTVHPPAGATAMLAVVDRSVVRLGWFLLPVILLGSVLMQSVALLLNNIQRRFPVYWWTPAEVGRRDKGGQQQQGQQQQKPQGQTRSSESGSDTSSKLEITASRHVEEGRVVDEPAKIVIRRGHVSVPGDTYITPEEKTFLEELSLRL